MVYSGDDIYCDQIIPRKIPIDIVYETDNVLAYHHTRPHWPVHIVVVPKVHVPSLLELNNPALAQDLLDVIQKVASQVKDQHGSCRVVSNLGDYQDSKHLHFHISSGQPISR